MYLAIQCRVKIGIHSCDYAVIKSWKIILLEYCIIFLG